MSQVEVEITGMVMTAQYGTLQTGAVLYTDAAFAKHLVEDCGAAKYRTAHAPEAPSAPAKLAAPAKSAAKKSKPDSKPDSKPQGTDVAAQLPSASPASVDRVDPVALTEPAVQTDPTDPANPT